MLVYLRDRKGEKEETKRESLKSVCGGGGGGGGGGRIAQWVVCSARCPA